MGKVYTERMGGVMYRVMELVIKMSVEGGEEINT
jgi:hypothetical protein